MGGYQTKTLLAQRDGAHCAYCSRPLVIERGNRDGRIPHELHATIDHRIPRARGGSDHPDNLSLACARCNSMKGAMTAREFLEARPTLAADYAFLAAQEAKRQARAQRPESADPFANVDAPWSRKMRREVTKPGALASLGDFMRRAIAPSPTDAR